MRNVCLSERKCLATQPTTTLSLAAHYPINQEPIIHMRDCVGLHDIEMVGGAEKPNISGKHCSALRSLALDLEEHKGGGQFSERVGVSCDRLPVHARIRPKANSSAHFLELSKQTGLQQYTTGRP